MVTLDRLVNVLGSYGVRLRFCPIPRSRALGSVVMHEVAGSRTVTGDAKMTSAQRIWISPAAYERLQQELATLNELCAHAVADEDANENATAVKRARQARIQQIHEMLINAVVGEDPPDDGIAERAWW